MCICMYIMCVCMCVCKHAYSKHFKHRIRPLCQMQVCVCMHIMCVCMCVCKHAYSKHFKHMRRLLCEVQVCMCACMYACVDVLLNLWYVCDSPRSRSVYPISAGRSVCLSVCLSVWLRNWEQCIHTRYADTFIHIHACLTQSKNILIDYKQSHTHTHTSTEVLLNLWVA